MGTWDGMNEERLLAALQRAVDLGCNFFDTALRYGNGKSEQLLGRLVKANPSRRLYSATKIPPATGTLRSDPSESLDDCFPPDHIQACVEKSLTNAGLDHLDLVQFHVWQDRWVEDDRWARALEELRSHGMIRAVGISLNRWEPWNGTRTVRSGLVDAVQVVYNLFDQNPEDELLPVCADMDVAVIARVPFDEGSLAGALTLDSSWPSGDWRNEYFRGEQLRETVERVNRLKGALPSEMTLPDTALRFVLAQPAVSTVIPGMRRVAHVDSNMACSDGNSLPKSLLLELRRHRWNRGPAVKSR